MPLLRQLEFAFRASVAEVVDLSSLEALHDAGVNAAGYSKADLETRARELLRANGAARIAMQLRVKWNSRLKTAAGRADYRDKLILLNPRLSEYPSEIDRTLRHELAHILAQFRAGRRRIPPHGAAWRQACMDLGIADEKRCHNLPFPVRTYNARFIYTCPNCTQEFRRVRRVRRVLACLACCRKYSLGKFDPRFRLRLRNSC
jgi:predicted SprT family Zn-dependent metalloprotease